MAAIRCDTYNFYTISPYTAKNLSTNAMFLDDFTN